MFNYYTKWWCALTPPIVLFRPVSVDCNSIMICMLIFKLVLFYSFFGLWNLNGGGNVNVFNGEFDKGGREDRYIYQTNVYIIN